MKTETINRIEVSAVSLTDALAMAVAEKKATIPILTQVLLRPIGNTVRVVSTTLDVTAITDIQGVSKNDTPILIPAHQVLDLLKGESGTAVFSYRDTVETVKSRKPGEYKDGQWIDGEEFDEEIHSHVMVLDVGSVSYELTDMNIDNFPVSPEVQPPQFQVTGAEFKGMLSRTSFAISKEESRYTINGILMKSGSGKFLAVATDGHRLAMEHVEMAEVPTAQAVVPSAVIQWLQKHVEKSEVGVHLGKENSVFSVPEIGTVLIARNVSGTFPNYEAVLPRKDSVNHTVTFPHADELAKVLTKVSKMSDSRSGAVKWKINGSCELSAASVDSGKATATVKADINHSDGNDELLIGLNSQYVLEFLKIAGKNPVSMSVKDSQSAALFEVSEIPNYSYVLMPMRI